MIRDARPSDREQLRALQTNLREPNPALLAYAVEGPPLVLVSAVDGTPAGYLVAFYDGESGYVAEIAVSPTHRREGRATQLLLATFDRLRSEGCSEVRLTVHPEDAPARRLYESAGFEEVGRESDYYADGSDGIVMGRNVLA
ncbi:MULTISPECIES: GNAT family N-acetyltransferase [Halorussus]|uniref:GNAT family N-acetyltransferase n=1 Tax=Halorussus TaxID=1070314 RepID=UPI00209E2283|nr:GNAT family N-acetyltransferase [Halorussus vallis]USZ77163.1 GNAT family N-acetyltransferase [Halorussus vallis]